MIETDRVITPQLTDTQLTELSTKYSEEHEPSVWVGRLKKFGKGVLGAAKTILMSKEKLNQQIDAARVDFEQASQEYHTYRLESGNDIDIDLSGVASRTRNNVLTDHPEARPLAERFHDTADVMEGLEKQRFTQRIGRRALVTAGIISGVVGGAVAAWHFKDAAFLSSAVDHAHSHLTHGTGPEFLPDPGLIPPAESIPTLPPMIAENGDSYWGMAIERWQQNGIAKPDIGQINDVKNILMQHGPVNPHGWLLPGDAVDPNAAEAFIHNSIGVK